MEHDGFSLELPDTSEGVIGVAVAQGLPRVQAEAAMGQLVNIARSMAPTRELFEVAIQEGC